MRPRRRRPPIESKKDRALAALLTSSTQHEAAAKCGLSDRTLRMYLQDDDFVREYDLRRQELIRAATAQLQQSLSVAVAALRDILQDDETSTTARIAAAKVLLEHGLKYSELYDLFRRLQAVEATLQQSDDA